VSCYCRQTRSVLRRVAGQPVLKSKDCYLEIKIRTNSVLLSDNYLHMNGTLKNFMLTGLTEAENVHFVLYNFVIGN